eukprot:NODE_47_length_32105_cov_1.240892.p4 type:complete len:516 gc:universal NODE_47_length_32105_cov_1.240892:5155-3608(-)
MSTFYAMLENGYPFEFGDYGDGLQPKCLKELQIMQILEIIKNKPNWQIKFATYSQKWKQELIEQDLPNEIIQYCFDELQDSLDLPYGPVDGTFQLFDGIESSLHHEFKQIMAQFQDVPSHLLDWHPNSNQQVLDIVHPSLFPLSEKSKLSNPFTLENCLQLMNSGQLKSPISSSDDIQIHYQWLPSEFELKNGKYEITSYINNLHPKHTHLYELITTIFNEFIPLFQYCLSHKYTNRIQVDSNWYPEEPEHLNRDNFENDEDYDDAWDVYYDNRVPEQPQIPLYAPKSKNQILNLPSHLQVIIKLANIQLTPENPVYHGGVWHIEGTTREQICATGIYYYDVENISNSFLSMRQSVCEPNYEQNDDNGVEMIYGLVNEGPLSQNIGEIEIQEGKLIVFPNLYQHKVEPFELLDKGKNGHRKILCFFLVHPNHKITSTKEVGPQQMDWFKKEILQDKSLISGLPELIFDKIMRYMDYPIHLEEAKEIRLKLMEERKYYMDERNEQLYEREFSLCEH